jgi:Na+/proline symporter
VQVLLFATLAIELKRKSPNAHTFLEVIKARYGVATHAVYITFGLITNILVTAMLLTGGSAVVSDLTGVPTAAACFLLPIGVVLYTMFGGIKATFLTDYVHTVMIFSRSMRTCTFVSRLIKGCSHYLCFRIYRLCHQRGPWIAKEGLRPIG